MKIDPIILLTIAVLVIFLILGAMIYKPIFEDPKTVFKEEPLQKDKDFQLSPGEKYVYATTLNNTQINMTYTIGQGPGCVIIKFMESLNLSESCLDKRGMDALGYNSTLENPHMLLFKPWMLALRENWHWSSTMYLSYDGVLHPVERSEYRVIRMEEYNNRTAFVVEIKAQGGAIEYEWVDMEKRMLLKTAGPGYEVRLVEGINFTK